ncbi:phenylacetate--CoA ligase family protein [uncultured Mitsuokella sp.]|uniref:phenylacetate--CoA ligase family protein n=1 Tax=uncultured Mitsuokella sp. TaxID=453120 RepID=UPI00266EA947|nr:phenylacetate--CoA ligase family protein [uncultured Mitsuokella sp.]
MFANPSVEQISAEALRELQLTRLQKQLRWAGEKCSHYRESFAEAGVSAKEVQELDALQNFPLLPRGVLQGKNAFDFLTMPLSSLLRISYMHSGQDEDNVFVHFATNGDIAHHVEQMTRSLVACGLHNAALVGILGDGADSRLMDIHYASEFIGAAVTMLGQDKKKWPQMLDFVTPETLIGTPKRLAELDDILQQKGSGLSELPLARIICLHASVPSSSLVTSVNDLAPAKVYHMLALPFLGTAAPFLPCEPSKFIFHLQEDYTMAEIIDPATKKPSAGSGELVLTSLAAEAMPVIRLCTGLMVEPAAGPCSCGRTHRRFRLLVG